jgi:prepilin-type N-terminal cleavage/methylation domain-containing protein
MRDKGFKKNRLTTMGFTLLEVLVSLAIMAIATTLVIQLFAADLRSIARSGDMTAALVRGEFRLRIILADPDLAEESWNETTEDDYRMGATVLEVMRDRTADLPVKLMEVTLTVRWMEGIREKSLSLKAMKMVKRIAPVRTSLFRSIES